VRLRERYGAGAVRQLSSREDAPVVHGDALLLLPAADTLAQGVVSDVLYLCIPAEGEAEDEAEDGEDMPSGGVARFFFFTGSGTSREEAHDWAATFGVKVGAVGSSIHSLANRAPLPPGMVSDSGGAFAQFERLCVCVGWGASARLEEALLRDLRATAPHKLPSALMLERLAVAKEETSFTLGVFFSVFFSLPLRDGRWSAG